MACCSVFIFLSHIFLADFQVNVLVEYYRQLAQKEKVEREKKKLTKRRNFMHLSVSNQLVHEQIDLFC